MPWRRPKKLEQRAFTQRSSPEERLELAAEGEEDRDTVELASIDGASLVEAATGEPVLDEPTPSLVIDAERLADAQVVTTSPASRPETGADLEVDAARGLRLKNPVLTASGLSCRTSWR